MPSSASTRHQKFLPYRFADCGLLTRITRCVLDGERPANAVPDIDRHLLDLSSQRFKVASLDLSVTLSREVLAAVLPAAETAHAPARLIALVRCDASRLRTAVEIAAGPLAPAIYSGAVPIRRDEIAGVLEVVTMLVRSAPCTIRDEGWAVESGARLASARPWEIRIDPSHSPRGEFLDIRVEDFKTAGPPRFPSASAMYQLECEGESPILWLNSANKRISSVLHNVANVGRAARIRDIAYERISVSVWIRLFLRAARDLMRLGEPVHPWQMAVLRHWLPMLYPDATDHESRFDAMRTELTDGDEGHILERLDLAIQTELETAHVFEILTDEIES